jgi:hypothetical protein
MANRTYLCGLNQNFFEDDDDQIQLNVLLEARYCLPLLWFTLFQPDDIKLYSNVPILLTSREAALANLDRNAPALAAFVGEPAATIVAHWRTFIEQNEYANYLVNTHELQMMEDQQGEFHHDLKQMMAEFASIVDGTAPTRELYVVGQADRSLAEYPYRGIPLHLCGVSFNRPMPWEERKKA